MRRALAIATAALPILALSACGEKDENYAKPSQAGGAVPAKPAVTITERAPFRLEPKDAKAARAGSVTIQIRNVDRIEHALAVEGMGVAEKSTNVRPGATSNLTVELKRGKYRMYCPIADHESKGMKGTLTVG